MRAILKDHFYIILDKLVADKAYDLLHITPKYKALAKLAHPDVGGDHDMMQQLNAAIEVVRYDRKKRSK